MIETQRLILRPGTLEDAPNLVILNSDYEVVRYTGDGPLANLLEAQNLVRERLIPQYAQYKMSRFTTLLKDGTYIGWCGLKYFPETDEVDLGYRFMKKYWGQGYATEASIAMLDYGFNTLNLKRIVARAMPENVGSLKVLQKIGMTFRGYKKEEGFTSPWVTYDIRKEEFNS